MSIRSIAYLVAILIVFSNLAVQAQDAPVPQLINYQGRLTGADGKELPTGDYKLSINLYSDPTATTTSAKVWGPQTFNVPVVKGHFNVILGPVDANNAKIQDAFTTSSIYLEVTVNDTSIIKPRQQVLSTPFALRALHGVPVGTIVPYFGLAAPDGWILCDGREIDKKVSPYLVNLVDHLRNPRIVGEAYAQSQSTSETSKARVPDMRGRMPLGLDNIGGTTADRVTATTGKTVGGNAGEEWHKLTTNEIPSHSHPFEDYTFSEVTCVIPGFIKNQVGTSAADSDNGPVSPYTHNTQDAGGNQSHNNMPPYLAMNYIIKY
jgi:microcystin-dependent protein